MFRIPVCRFLFSFLAVCLPFYGLSIITVGDTVVQNDWIVAALLISVFMGVGIASARLILYRAVPFYLLFAFVAFLVLSVKNPIQKGHLIEYSATLFQYLLGISLFLSISHVEWSNKDIQKLMRFIIVFTSLIASFGIIQFLLSLIGIDADLPVINAKYTIEEAKSGYERLLFGMRRATSVFIEPRHFGNYLITPICLTFMTLIDRKQRLLKQKLYGIILGFLMVVGFLLSFSASAYTILFLSMPVTAIVAGLRIKRLLLLMAEGCIALLLILICFQIMFGVNLVDYIVTRFNIGTLLSNFDVEATTFGLSKYLRGCFESLALVRQNYLFGVGLNQVQFFINRDWATVIPPFTLLASIGVFGFFLFVLFLVFFVGMIIKLKSEIFPEMQEEKSLLKIAELYVLLIILKPFAMSRYNYGSIILWFDLSVAGLIYFNIRRRWRAVKAEIGSGRVKEV